MRAADLNAACLTLKRYSSLTVQTVPRLLRVWRSSVGQDMETGFCEGDLTSQRYAGVL